MVNMIEREAPLYTIKAYNEYLYRVCKRLFNPLKPSVKEDKPSEDKPIGKFDSALSRAKNMVREISLCNDWEVFVTLTFDDRWDRYCLVNLISEFLQWIQNLNKNGYRIKYILVPEFHKDGAVHLHGLMSGIPMSPRPDWWPKTVNLKDDGTYYDIWPEFSERYGFSAVEPVHSMIGAGFYAAKYITKSLADRADMFGVHTYYRSKGLKKAVQLGSVYTPVLSLDKCCKYSNEFYSFGFFKCDDVADLTDLCAEVNDMFKSYIVTDPVSGEMVSMFGGDDEDIFIQEMIAGFQDSGLRCCVYDFSDDLGG